MTRKTRLASPHRVRDQSIWHSVSDFLKRVLDIGLAWQYTSLRKQHTRIVGRQFLVCSQGDDSLGVVKLRNTVYSDKQIKELFESMSVEELPVSTYLVSLGGRFLSWSPQIPDILGVESSALRSCSITDFYVDARQRKVLIDKLDRAESHGGWLENELIALRVGRQIKYVRDYCRSVEDSETGQRTGFVGCLVDVTDEGVYNLLSRRLGIAIFAADLEDRILFVNQPMTTLFGYSDRESMVGLSLEDVFEHESSANELRSAIVDQGEVSEVVVGMKSRDGSLWTGSITAVLDSTGTHFAGRISNVTMEMQYKQMLDEMPVGTFMYHHRGGSHILARCNDRYAEMLGFSDKEEIVEKSIDFTHADYTKLQEYLVDLNAEGRLEGYDVKLSTKRGKQFTAKVWAKKLRGIGDLEGRVGAVIDVSEESALRERITELTRNIGQILHTYSQTLLSIRLKTRSVLRYFQPDPFGVGELPDAEAIAEVFARPKRALEMSVGDLTKSSSDSGGGTPALQSAYPLLNSLVTRLERDRAEFTPVSGLPFIASDIVRLCDSLLKREVPRELVKRTRDDALEVLRLSCVVSAHYTVDRIVDLDFDIKSMRDFVTEGVQHHEKPEVYAVRDIVRASYVQLVDYARSRDIDIRLIETSEPYAVNVVVRQMVRALSNVLHNAIKYSWTKPSGGTSWIQIRSRRIDDLISIEVENYGVAIPEIEIESGLIYNLGFRGRLSQDRGRVGTGIGLADTY